MLKHFRIGGIHPPESKLTAGKPIISLGVPKQAVILLSQHIGAPAQCIVNKGDKVKVGTLIAKANGFVSANIHSSVSGTISAIQEISDGSGFKKQAVIVDVEDDIWEEKIDRSETLIKECKLSPEEIITRIGENGIVGMGGATFPTQVKLTPPPGMNPYILIINAVECEPYLTNDHALMLAKPQEILVGVSILMKAIRVQKAAIGIENNKPDAIKLLSELSKEYPGIEICPLKVRYPQGSEKQLIEAITGKQVASGALPISTGAVVQNVASVFAVYEAVQKNKPLFERIATVTGKSVKTPANISFRIGTPVSKLIDAAGGLPDDSGKIILGGPMMGKAAVSVDIPTTKGTSGILIMPSLESQRQKMSPCIRCGKCVMACPMGLSPYLLMTCSESDLWDKAESEHITDCIECGCCSFSCPSHRPLLDYIRIGKCKVSTIIRNRTKK